MSEIVHAMEGFGRKRVVIGKPGWVLDLPASVLNMQRNLSTLHHSFVESGKP